jgi:hypothetical protein
VKKPLQSPKRVETRTISDAESPPSCCPNCQSNMITRYSYYYRDLQELGSPIVARRVRYEAIAWYCKACQTTFALHNPLIPSRSPFMPEIMEYARYRILTKGDSAGRVVEDLHNLHQVEISDDTLLSWINPKQDPTKDALNATIEPEDFPTPEFSGVLGVDGTFKSVKAKKNEPLVDETGPHLLHLTHLPDGRLVAYWPAEKPKSKSLHSLKK